jgi:membrane-bound lytic murein transglycosylase F
MMKKTLLLILPFLFLLLSCKSKNEDLKSQPATNDFDRILSRGKLVVATGNNSVDYFLYKGEPMGFQFELLQEFGNYLGIKIEVLVCNNPSENIALLKKEECDIIASSWSLARNSENLITHSLPILQTNLVLVQRKPSEILGLNNNNDGVIKDIKMLKGKSIFVPLKSTQAEAMHKLASELNENFNIYEMPQYSQEKLVELVATGDIEYTICNSNLIESFKTIYPELDFETVIKKSEPIVWNFRKSSTVLESKVNEWLNDFKSSTRYTLLINRYFSTESKWAQTNDRYDAINAKSISKYDAIIKKYSEEINWDWRLLASLIYQESRFKPQAKSNRGAWGLMQLMPSTRKYFGIDTTATPEQQIKAGVRYIKFLDNVFKDDVKDKKERIHFILASYNIGPGHIFDAQKIAVKLGKEPTKWFNSVDSCLLSKSNPEHYKDPEIQFGYCKGTETFNFVQEIMGRFHHYKNVISL